MTREKLEAYHALMKDIAVKEEYIRIFKERSGEVASPCLDGLPHGSDVGNPTMKYAIEAADLEARLEYMQPGLCQDKDGRRNASLRLFFSCKLHSLPSKWRTACDKMGFEPSRVKLYL